MLRNFVRFLLHKYSFVWNVLSQEEYLEKTSCTDVSSQSSFHRKLLEIALEEVRKREEESRKRDEEARKRDEEARKREADLQELVRKLLQDVGYTNHQFAGGSGQQEQQHFRKDN